jgi:hypothetical protein
VGTFKAVFDTVIVTGIFGYCLLFALLFWAVDKVGSLGLALGAKDTGEW